MKPRFQYGALAILLLFTAGACSQESIRPSSIFDALPRLLSTGAKIAPTVPVNATTGEVFHVQQHTALQSGITTPSWEFPIKSGMRLQAMRINQTSIK